MIWAMAWGWVAQYAIWLVGLIAVGVVSFRLGRLQGWEDGLREGYRRALGEHD
jgi:hypothetical protein